MVIDGPSATLVMFLTEVNSAAIVIARLCMKYKQWKRGQEL